MVGLAIGIPTAFIGIALAVWAYFFYKKGGFTQQVEGYKEIDADEDDSTHELMEKQEDFA